MEMDVEVVVVVVVGVFAFSFVRYNTRPLTSQATCDRRLPGWMEERWTISCVRPSVRSSDPLGDREREIT